MSAKRVWTSLDLLKWTREYFERKGVDSPRLTAELLLADALGCDRVRLYLDFEKPVADEPLARFREFVKRRGEGREPVAYILGHAEFLDLRLKVTPAVLIPRPETEELANWAIAALKLLPGEALRGLDLGTGSGCLALALASKEPRLRVTAVDCSAAALAVARENGAALKLAERVAFLEGDLWTCLPGADKGAYDIVVSNPPYVDPALRETLAPEVREHEPVAALFAPDAGLAVVRRICAEAAVWLKPGGLLGIEFSPAQVGVVRELLSAKGEFSDVTVHKDAQGLERFVTAGRK